MASGFETNELLYPLTKGDTPGHPFRGNQFTQGEGGAVKVDEMRKAGNSLSFMHQGDSGEGIDHKAIASGHTALANAYGQRLAELDKQYEALKTSGKSEEEADEILGKAYLENETAQGAHEQAALANKSASRISNDEDEQAEKESDAEDATNQAANQGEATMRAEKALPAEFQSKTLPA
jgi:hypothetical protein